MRPRYARMHDLRMYAVVGAILIAYFVVYFLLIVRTVEYNEFHPFVPPARDANGVRVHP